MLKSKVMVGVFIVVISVAAIFGLKQLKRSDGENSGSRQSAKMMGPNNAPIRIVEFLDYQCPSCAMGSAFLHEWMANNPGKAHLEVKYFPLRMHRHAFKAAQYAECAARQDNFWSFHDQVLEAQKKWYKLEDTTPVFDSMAQNIGLDMTVLAACLEDPTVGELIVAHLQEGRERGIRMTPTYFVNNMTIVGSKSLKMELEKLMVK